VLDIRELKNDLVLPLIVAPMTGISGPDLVIASCLAGVIGSFPTGNCKSTAELDEWLTRIQTARTEAKAQGKTAGGLAVNLIIRNNKRLIEDAKTLAKHNVDFVITAVGSPTEVLPVLHDSGIAAIAAVASMRHAELALEARADGLVLLSAGAGGHTGWANGFAFVRAVRETFQGPLVQSGGIIDGTALWAYGVLGYDYAYMGTKMIATPESMATDEYRQKLLEITMDDIDVGVAPNGVKASMIRGGGGSAGHSVMGVKRIMNVREVVEQTVREYAAAKDATRKLLA
jgi:nitronate monooxygenase